jgi:hypothetical protein
MDLEQRVRMEMPQMPRPMEQNVTMAQTYSLSVVNEQPSGGRELEMTFLAQELEVSMAGQIMMSFDSKADPSEDKDNPFAAPYRSMIGSSLRLVLDASNRVTDVPNLKQWMDKLTAKAPPMAQASLQQMYNPEYFKQLVEFSRSFPPNPVRTGESWSHEQEITAGPMGKFALQTQNTLKGSAQREQRECAVISFTGTMKSSGAAQPGPMGKVSIDKGQMTGTNWFDASLGAVIESNSEQDMELKIEMPAQAGPMAGKSIPGKIRQTVALKLVDLARPGK